MLRAIPFLLFDGDCEEAMTFYHQCLGGDLEITKLRDTPMRDQFPQEKYDRTINAHLKSEEIEISASDWMASPEFNPTHGNTYAIFVIGNDQNEIQAIFNNLKAGGGTKHLQELHEMPFGIYGQMYDRYGVQWIFKGEKNIK